ncbi:DNA mismatch repair endonuclease MutL [Egbenema bharatensis]|uniref:DNA mismatch repair endonuclease MutL n=1 Tax=Egbenema bharatensis TaxID=3463334 RepID=UPI003A8B5051
MSSIIQTLPTDVVDLIAAGEVIDSLAAVVRELAENALDAGATRITISLWPEQWCIQIADNGSGMTLADLEQAAIAHSTSKIQSSQDLWQISSLGFRGEALHSLAQLAQLELCSRDSTSSNGWRVQYTAQGEPAQVEPIALAPGTIVTVSNLFGNWLPRRAGFPPLTQQLRLIQQTIQQLALCHPHITWQVQQGDRPWFNIWAGTSAQQILPQILREVQVGDLREVRVGSRESGVESRESGVEKPGEPSEALTYLPTHPPTHPPTHLPTHPLTHPSTLLLGLPDRCHRRRPDWIKVAVNGRVVRVAELEQTILGAFRRMLPRDRYPVCFLHLQLPPNLVDWNRHPAKAEIYLHSLLNIQQAVTRAIDHALHLQNHTLPEAPQTARISHLIKAAEPKGHYRSIPPTPDSRLPTPDSRLPTPDSPLTPLKALAQVHQMYILAEHPTGVWLVEQHIAHERVLYEQLSDRWQLVPLESPVILNELSLPQQEQLHRIGIEIELFGDRLWAARSMPEALVNRGDRVDAILELSLGGDLESALVATACRTAIRNGTPLSLMEMQTLLDQWQQTRNPRTCPHGRPIYLQLQESSLSRFFRRHWVIGKSHGI